MQRRHTFLNSRLRIHGKIRCAPRIAPRDFPPLPQAGGLLDNTALVLFSPVDRPCPFMTRPRGLSAIITTITIGVGAAPPRVPKSELVSGAGSDLSLVCGTLQIVQTRSCPFNLVLCTAKIKLPA